MGNINREFYSFSNSVKEERLIGCEGKCESCGVETKLFGHHLISCFLASNNSVLASQIIRSIDNLQMLCKDCHQDADDHQKTWNAYDIGVMAWAIFDLDLHEVAAGQKETYPLWTRRSKSKKKKRNTKGRRRF